MNLEQIQEFPRGEMESGELFRNDEVLQPIVDPDAINGMRVRDWSINKEALFISFATGPAESDLYEWCRVREHWLRRTAARLVTKSDIQRAEHDLKIYRMAYFFSRSRLMRIFLETGRRVYGLERAALRFSAEEIIQLGRKRDEIINELEEIIRAPSDDMTDRVFTNEIRDVMIEMAETWGNRGIAEAARKCVLPYEPIPRRGDPEIPYKDGMAYGGIIDLRDLLAHIPRPRIYDNPWKICRFPEDRQGSGKTEDSPIRNNREIYPVPKNRRKEPEISRSPMRSGSGQECSLITSGSSILQSRTERTSTTEKASSSSQRVGSRNVYELHHQDVDLGMSDSSSGFSRVNQSEKRSSESSSRIIAKARSRSRSRSKSGRKSGSGKSNSINTNERFLYQRAIDQSEMDRIRLQKELDVSREKEEAERARAKALEEKTQEESVARSR